MNHHENCTYCSGFNVIHHSEGVTCSDCCRLQPLPLYLGSETGCWEGRDLQLSEKYPELRNLVDRHLINEEVGRESRIMVDHLRKHNVNLSSVMLMVIAIHQAMIKVHKACFSICQLSSLLVANNHPNTIIKQYVRLTQKFPKTFLFSPFHPNQYIPLNILINCEKILKSIFNDAHNLQKKSGYLLQLSVCVFVVVKASPNSNLLDLELLEFICDFPKNSILDLHSASRHNNAA